MSTLAKKKMVAERIYELDWAFGKATWTRNYIIEAVKNEYRCKRSL
jgi:hypothetical protein